MTRPEYAEATVGALLDRSADAAPDGMALVIADRRLTYAQLRAEVDDVAAGLLAAGIRPGERVCLFTPNLPESYVALLAAAKIGAVFVPLNPRLTPRELEYALTASGAVALLFVPEWRGIDYAERLRSLWPDVGAGGSAGGVGDVRLLVTLRGELPGSVGYDELLESGRSALWQQRRADAQRAVGGTDIALLQFTSGTTSQPKGVLLAHSPTARMATELGVRFALSEADRYFGCPPICHVGGTTFSFLAVISQAATFFTLPVFDAEDALTIIDRERCTVLHGIDSHLHLLTSANSFDSTKLGLRLVSVSGVEQTVRAVNAAFPDAVVISQYGSTELGGAPICSGAGDPESQRLGSVGRPLPGVDVMTAETGEIRVGGWSLMAGYLDQPEATAQLFDEAGRVRTGDLGYVDDDGCVHFTGRLKNMLRTGGENVSVEEVESVLGGFPGVSLAVVVGVPDQRLGEVGYAFLLADPAAAGSIDIDAVRRYSRGQLATFKVPRHFEVCDSGRLAMTASGKIQRAELRSLAQQALNRSA
jgi:fatty-acyl-CoA synthase